MTPSPDRAPAAGLRIVYLGRRCAFSRLPLEAILGAGLSVAAVIIPADREAADGGDLVTLAPPALPMAAADPVGWAHAGGIPAYAVRRLRGAGSLAVLAGLRPDVICAACFPRRLPPEWLAVPRLGAINLHPSLLPAYRGPEPIFWQFRAGEARPGVSVHRMDAGLDTGPILAQAETPWPDGLDEPEAERRMAEAGGRLLVELLAGGLPAGRPQSGAGASWFPRPGPAERVIPAAWPARRAYNFLRGAAAWGPFQVVGRGRSWPARSALDFTPEGPPPYRAAPPAEWVPFSPGAVLVQP